MKLNKLSMFAIGAAVLTLSACTVADEFESYNKDGKKYITKFKIMSDASSQGTRTYFDVDDEESSNQENLAKVYWEDGTTLRKYYSNNQDEIYFIHKDENGNYAYAQEGHGVGLQTFKCTEVGEWKPETPEKGNGYGWGEFTANAGNQGLELGETYYAYYYPKYKTDQKLPIGRENRVPNINIVEQSGQDASDFIDFMRQNDILELDHRWHSNNEIKMTDSDAAQNGIQIEDIHMDHVFALVEVELHYKESKTYVGSMRPDLQFSFPSVELGTDEKDELNEDVRPFISSFYLDEYGKWVPIKGENKAFAQCIRTDVDNDNLVLRRSDEVKNDNPLGTAKSLRYFLLVRFVDNVKVHNLWIKTLTQQGDQGFRYMRTLHYIFPNEYNGTTFEGVSFEPGNYYKFDINISYENIDGDNPPIDSWQNYGKMWPANEEYLKGFGIVTNDSPN